MGGQGMGLKEGLGMSEGVGGKPRANPKRLKPFNTLHPPVLPRPSAQTFLAYEDPRQDILIGLLRLRKIAGASAVWHSPYLACCCLANPPDFACTRPLHPMTLRMGCAFLAAMAPDILLPSHIPSTHPHSMTKPLLYRRPLHAGSERQPELGGACSVVRELHVYGTAVAVHARDSSKFQHQG